MLSLLRSGGCRACFALLIVLVACSTSAFARQSIKEPSPFDEKAALEYSQAAIGRTIDNLQFLNRKKESVSLQQFRKKPLIINMVYTSCSTSCPMIVESLYDGVKIAQDALGEDAFNVLTIGFDTRSDSPARMRGFASTRGVSLPNWHFLSGTEEAVTKLTETLGFIYVPSPAGFEHLTQTTVIDAEGEIYRHVYGANFSAPTIVEPLKELVFGKRKPIASLDGLFDRVRLFCTIYDPRNDRYYFDYSIFVGLSIGFLCLLAIAGVLLRNFWRLWRQERAAKMT